jgi:hypothetical protein
MQTPPLKVSRSSHIQLSTWKSQLAILFGTTVASLMPVDRSITVNQLAEEIVIAGSSVPDLTRCQSITPENTQVLTIGNFHSCSMINFIRLSKT